MLSQSEFGVEDPFEEAKKRNAFSTTPFSMAPHSEGYFSTQDKMLSMPSSGAHQIGLAPVGGGALKGSFAFKNTAFG